MDSGNRKLQYAIAFAVSIASITAGVSLSWSTPVIPKFHDNKTNIHITDSEISWMAALSSPGYMAGSLTTRFTADRFGRRATILGSALPIAIGTVFIVTSSQAWMLFIGRFLWGCGTGMIGTVSIMYLAEIANKEIRGTLAIVIRFMLNFGCFLVMAIGPFVSYQVLNYMLIVLPITYFISCWWIPETPYYYLKEGKVENARKVLMKLSSCKDDKILEDRLSLMRSDVNKEMTRSGSLKELLTGKQYRRAVVIVVGLKVTQIMSGSNAIQQYLGRITQESNSGLQVSTALIIFGAVRFCVGVMSSMLVDRLGRRPLLIYSYFGAGITLTIVGAYFYTQNVIGMENPGVYSFIPFIGIICSSIITGLGYDTVAYVIPPEIFPLNVKSVAMTFSNILGGLLNFVTVKAYQQLKDLVGLQGAFWFYAVISFSGAFFSYFLVPETKGKSLREIQIELNGDVYDEACERLNEVNDKNDTELQELRKNSS